MFCKADERKTTKREREVTPRTMTLSLPQGGNAALAQIDHTAQTVFIGLNSDLLTTTLPVEIDPSLFLLDAAGMYFREKND